MKLKDTRKFLISLVICCLASCIIFISPVLAEQEAVDIYFFHSQTCPHCLKQKPLMENVAKLNSEVKLHAYEVSEQSKIWRDFLAQHQLKSEAVPRTVIGDKQFIGYSESEGKLEYNEVYQGYIGYQNQIIAAIETELGHPINLAARELKESNNLTESPLPWQLLALPVLYLLTYPLIRKKILNRNRRSRFSLGLIAVTMISLFCFFYTTPDVVIKEFAQSLPFPLFVSTIALADGFNPCAFTVLIILLSLLTHTRSRKQMAVIGSTFVATSAVMYFIFIMAMVLVGSLFLEKYGTLAMLVGEQNKLMFFTALSGTILLAIFVNIIELGCTAILPAVYMTSLLQYCTANRWLCSVFWTAIYAVIYIIPLMAILVNFIYSFKSSRLSETQGKVLKLTSGIFMLFFGILMIFKPELLTFN